MRNGRRLAASAAMFIVIGACSNDSGVSSDTAGPLDTSTTTVVEASTAAPTTTEVCDVPIGLGPVEVNWPYGLTALFATEMRTGVHRCYERVVIEFAPGTGFPGYSVRYEPDPLTLGSSGETVDLRGSANLIISVTAWMGDIEHGGYQGPRQVFPADVVAIREVHLLENFEAVHIWGIGLDRQRPFRVRTLLDPPRLVVDIATA